MPKELSHEREKDGLFAVATANFYTLSYNIVIFKILYCHLFIRPIACPKLITKHVNQRHQSRETRPHEEGTNENLQKDT